MPAPFDVPAVFRNLIPRANENKCSVFNKVMLQIPLKLYQVFNFLFDGDEINDTFRSQLWPPGASFESYATTTPAGRWLECNGAAVSRVTYADLFAAIGTTYGDGDAATTFNLPDRRGRSGIGTGTLLEADEATNGATYAQGDKIGTEDHVLEMAELPAEPPPLGTNTSGEMLIKRSVAVADDIVPLLGAISAHDIRGRNNAHVDHDENALGDLGDGDGHENRGPRLVLRCWVAY